MSSVYLATPTYDGNISVGTHSAIIQALLGSPLRILPSTVTMSLLCRTFNTLWAEALNRRAEGFDRFVMIHADIWPLEDGWLDKLLGLLDDTDVDVLSAVVPIKGGQGTSTAAEKPDGSLRRRLTKTDLAALPPTVSDALFRETTGERLLINTGLMAIRLDREWNERFCFAMDDCIFKDDEGSWQAGGTSEDWIMSHWLADNGIPYGFTREIPLRHIGTAAWEMK